MNPYYPKLFSPMTLDGVELKNRLVMAPMSTSYGGVDGSVTPRNIAFYRERALGGFGLIIVEFTCVDPATGKTEEHQLSLESHRNLDGHKRLVDAVHDAGAKVFVQLQHGGRFADRKYVPVPKGPSRVVSRKDPGKVVSDEFTSDEIKALIEAFARSAHLAVDAGYDGIEVHAAHGYLVSQFISPLGNQRGDEWGGDAERRLAFPLSIARAIRAEIGSRPLVFRISADEFLPGGVTIEDSEKNARRLVGAGVSVIHASTGRGPDSFEKVMEPMSTPEGWRIPYARRLRDAAGVPVITVGQIRTPDIAETAIANGDADLVALGRPSLADAEWPNKVAAGRFDDVRPCTSCNWCISGATRPMSCAENPRTGNELEPLLPKDAGAGKRAVVIGAGPGGLTAALMLDQAGFETHLYEARDTIGGGLIASATPPGKEKFFWYRDFLIKRLQRSRVSVHLGHRATAAEVIAACPHAVFVATGTKPHPMPIAGIDSPMVLDTYEVLMGSLKHGLAPGQHLIVYGGGETGCEAAEYFAEQGLKVTLVSRSPADKLARSAEMVYRKLLVGRLMKSSAIEIVLNTEIVRIGNGEIELRPQTGETRVLKADRIAIAQGRDPQDMMIDEFVAAGIQCHVIGDSHQVGRVGHAVHAAYHAMRAMRAQSQMVEELAC
jgi:2,4-dienoyl-CoA reductase-like NADH-dependent reductase (Old Yellow Enzyme family)/thioredoxin reductase